MIEGLRKRRAIHLALVVAMLAAPVVQATESANIQVAAAIGAEPKPTTPATKPPAAKTTTPPKTTTGQTSGTTTTAAASEPDTGVSNWVWIGLGAAALLAIIGGGGGGNGGSTSDH